jgi:hypothetical protein
MQVYPTGILEAMNNSIKRAGGQPLFEVGPANFSEELTIDSPAIQRYLAEEMARPSSGEKGIEAQQDFMLKAQEQLQRAESFKDGYLEIKDRFSKSMLKEDNLRFYFFEPAEETLKDFATKQLENAFQKNHLEKSLNENHQKRGESSLKKDFETFIKSDIFQARLEERVSQIYKRLVEQSPELNEAFNEIAAAERKQHKKDRNYQSIEDLMQKSLEDMFHLIVIPLLDHQV